MTFVCGRHRAYVYEMGGEVLVAELPLLQRVRWQRVRDDVSTAEAVIPMQDECCELVANLRTIKHELHIYRNDEKVWEGPITRIEISFDSCSIFAEDVLWITRRSMIETGYSHAYPNIGYVVDRMEWLLYHAYAKGGDRWRMTTGHIRPIRGTHDPKTSRVVFSWQMYVWEDLDKYAEDYGSDYVVVNRDVYFFDTQLKWFVIAPLREEDLSEPPRVVEYGNQLATRGVVTNGRGFAGVSAFNSGLAEYGVVDWLITNEIDGTVGAEPGAPQPTPPSGASEGPPEPTEAPDSGPPSPEEIAQWAETAARNIAERSPPPVAIVIPENNTLLPSAPWNINQLVPGAWFQMSVTSLCRQVSEWQRLQEVVVLEEAPKGETVQFTAASAPKNPVDYYGPPPFAPPPACITFDDRFTRADGPLGAMWQPGVLRWVDEFFPISTLTPSIVDGHVEGPEDLSDSTSGVNDVVATIATPGDQFIQIIVTNYHQGHFTFGGLAEQHQIVEGEWKLYCQANDTNFSCVGANVEFFVSSATTAELFGYFFVQDAAGHFERIDGDISLIGFAWPPPAGDDTAEQILRLEVTEAGEARFYGNGVLAGAVTVAPLSGNHVGFGFNWHNTNYSSEDPVLGTGTSFHVEEASGGCLEG